MQVDVVATTEHAADAAQVLIVTRDPFMARSLERMLDGEGHALLTVGSGEAALALIGHASLALVILEAELPGMSGFETCRSIRRRSDVPVIFFTDTQALAQRLEGFDAGCDDYISARVPGEELKRRVRAVLRRLAWSPADEGRELRGPSAVVMRAWDSEVTVGERPVRLTTSESRLFRFLLMRRFVVQTKQTLGTALRGPGTRACDNVVEKHISRLRWKLNAAGAAGVVATVRGIGYVIR